MDDNKLRFGVGVLVIAAIGIGIILTLLFGAFPTVLAREYTLDIEFPSAAGVGTDTDVLRDGVKIGRVVDIKLLKTQGVLVRLAMDEQFELTHEYIPRIGVGSVITGEATVEFVRADPQQLNKIYNTESARALIPKPYIDEEYYYFGQKRDDPFNVLFGLEDELRQTMQSIRSAGDSIDTAGQNVNALVTEARQVVGGTDDNVDAIADEAVEALKQFQEAIKDVRKIVGDPELRESLNDSLAAVPDVLKEANKTFESTRRTFESFEKVGTRFEKVGEFAEDAVKEVGTVVDNVNKTVNTARTTIEDTGKRAGSTLQAIEGTFKSAERTAQNIERISEPIAENSDQIVAQVLQSLRSVDRALAQVESFGASLNNSNGTVKRLLEDDQIYWQLRRTIENVEQASARIKPILDDVRIFSDKVARDPRQLGVRGAITRRPNGIGLK